MRAFSNGFEYDEWSAHWCGCCTKDETGYAPEGTWCPILGEALLGDTTPPQWLPGTDDLRDRYHCTDFEGGGGRGDNPVGELRPVGGLCHNAVMDNNRKESRS